MYEGMNFREFNQFFKNEDDCRGYLFNLKWRKQFRCRRCAHDKFWPGRTQFHARCRNCNYDESPTAHTVFHKIQFSLLKAFSITFYLTVLKKGVSSRNLAEIIGVNPKTALCFMHKLQDAMGSWVSAHIDKAEIVKTYGIDSIIVTDRPAKLNGLQRVNMTMKQIRVSAKVKLIQCKGFLPDERSVDPCHLVAGRYVDQDKNILAWNFKSWLTGVHHHCSDKYRQRYLDEYSFKFCHRNNKHRIWHTLLNWVVISGSMACSGTRRK